MTHQDALGDNTRLVADVKRVEDPPRNFVIETIWRLGRLSYALRTTGGIAGYSYPSTCHKRGAAINRSVQREVIQFRWYS